MENEMETGVLWGLYRDPSIQIIPRLGPKVCKHPLHWAIWIPRIHSVVHPSLQKFEHSGCHLLFIHSLVLELTHSSVHSFVHSFFIHSIIHLFVHSLTHSLTHSFTHSFIHSFIQSFTHSSVCSFIHSFIFRSFVHSFILFKHTVLIVRSFIH